MGFEVAARVSASGTIQFNHEWTLRGGAATKVAQTGSLLFRRLAVGLP